MDRVIKDPKVPNNLFIVELASALALHHCLIILTNKINVMASVKYLYPREYVSKLRLWQVQPGIHLHLAVSWERT